MSRRALEDESEGGVVPVSFSLSAWFSWLVSSVPAVVTSSIQRLSLERRTIPNLTALSCLTRTRAAFDTHGHTHAATDGLHPSSLESTFTRSNAFWRLIGTPNSPPTTHLDLSKPSELTMRVTVVPPNWVAVHIFGYD
ncbi:hypothetical protein BDQ17DRAFT_1436217 [Cyathus striatus]|nr:hypothetical protein BDQ17DRAFT_1436217 [Cyathus striatus]